MNFCHVRIKHSNPQTLVLDGVETGVLLPVFAEKLRRRNAKILDFQITAHDTACIFPTLVPNKNAQTKKKRKLGSFKNMNVRCRKKLTTRVVLFMGLCTT